MSSSTLYWRLSAFYLFYFAILGVIAPYFPLYLKSLGFSPAAIGEIMAAFMLSRTFAPYFLGWLADHNGRSMQIVRWACFFALVVFSGVFYRHTYGWLIFILAVYGIFWSAALPQFEVTTFFHLGKSTHHYSHIRIGGSIGFILTVVGLGKILEILSVEIVPQTIGLLLMMLWLVRLMGPKRCPQPHQEHLNLKNILRRPTVLALLASCFLMHLGHAPYYTFYTLYLEKHGYTRSLIGQLWALGVIAEIVIFLVMYRLLQRFSLRQLLLASLTLTVCRWLIIGNYVLHLPILAAAQLLHAASFAIFHGTAIQLVHRYFTGKFQGRGQALYNSISMGAGGALGALSSGYLWETFGGTSTFMLAAVSTLFSLWISWRWLETH